MKKDTLKRLIKKLLCYLQPTYKWIKERIAKNPWYAFLIIISSAFVIVHRDDICELKEFNATNLIFILWLVLLLLPLISEMEFLGIKIKKEVGKATGEIKKNLDEVKMQLSVMQNINWNYNQKNSVDNRIYISDANISKADLVEGKRFNAEVNEGYKESLKEKVEIMDEISIDLYKTKLLIENKLREVCKTIGIWEKLSIPQMLTELKHRGVIDNETLDLITKAMSIINKTVHGDTVEKDYIDYVVNITPKISIQLDNIISEAVPIVCPRCKYRGYSLNDNQCPQCGYVFMDC